MYLYVSLGVTTSCFAALLPTLTICAVHEGRVEGRHEDGSEVIPFLSPADGPVRRRFVSRCRQRLGRGCGKGAGARLSTHPDPQKLETPVATPSSGDMVTDQKAEIMR